MAKCLECGTTTVLGEAFCSNCGTKNPVPATESPAPGSSASDAADDNQESSGAAAAMSPEQAEQPVSEAASAAANESASSEDDLVSSDSLGGSTTGEVPIQVKHTIKKGNTGGHQPTIKQLDPGSVLNARYEIV